MVRGQERSWIARGRTSAEDLLGGAAAFSVLGGEIFALRGLDEIDVDEADALLFGEADGGACRLADWVVGDGLWRAGDFADDVGLFGWEAADPGGEAARAAKVSTVMPSIGFRWRAISQDYFQFFFGPRKHAGGDFFAADFEKQLQLLVFRRT